MAPYIGGKRNLAARLVDRIDAIDHVTYAEVFVGMGGVTIECLDYREFIRRYDGPETLFYLDPPYWGSEGDYGKELFGRTDFADLAETLADIEGRFILSINDPAEVRKTFAAFPMEPVETTYSIVAGATKRAGELIISNASKQG